MQAIQSQMHDLRARTPSALKALSYVGVGLCIAFIIFWVAFLACGLVWFNAVVG